MRLPWKTIPFGAAPVWGQLELNKPPSRGVLAQIEYSQPAPKKVSTPFPKNRYQIIAIFWERCRYFCKKTPVFCEKRSVICIFSILYNAFTAFAPRIRGPPHLDLIHSNSNDRRGHYGMAEKWRIRTRRNPSKQIHRVFACCCSAAKSAVHRYLYESTADHHSNWGNGYRQHIRSWARSIIGDTAVYAPAKRKAVLIAIHADRKWTVCLI